MIINKIFAISVWMLIVGFIIALLYIDILVDNPMPKFLDDRVFIPLIINGTILFTYSMLRSLYSSDKIDWTKRTNISFSFIGAVVIFLIFAFLTYAFTFFHD